jgi:4-carboxymuconolactone decarboxylase
VSDVSAEELRLLVRICSCVARRDEATLRSEFLGALQRNLSLLTIREAVLQTYLFAGYAATINAFIILNEIAPGNSEFFRQEQQSLDLWYARGTQLCQQIYGSQYETLVHNMKHLHPDLADWILWEGYGKVLARPFLSPIVRELLIVGMTAVLQVERQFHSHVRGALNVGATPEQIRSSFLEVKPDLPPAIAEKFESILNDVL